MLSHSVVCPSLPGRRRLPGGQELPVVVEALRDPADVAGSSATGVALLMVMM